ncbi:MAG TPA: Sec-dependent nitrous-oxide reductase [Persephonella sp.]|uniref:Nitrous-oxide reductase n=1 Tax=Persephonella marina (strain DSM 14350 / EX-H1) TaxID=123214 RepID=C0QQT4_PERMH|nr:MULTISPECIES: Sec-dependent nitrous-oxide reductase [Persephonella]ACO03623.1 nitrous-oxide reductase [Persephonella marina EX-H1]HCB68780.1 Sec-dependent nitrous-oxide reductase [Persephonella sp.]
MKRKWRLGVISACAIGFIASTAHAQSPAEKVYVPPGKHDEFYAFLSGGFSGQLSVYGLPSGRLIKVIPVFSVNPENGYGYSEETKAMLMTSHGFIPWGDTHHPELSQTNGVPDGRWIFINENNTPRVARIDLRTFETIEILEIPNSGGNHASAFVTPNTEYITAGTRFSVPIPQKDVPIASYAKNFKGTLTFIRADKPGKMDIAFQILVPGYDYDLAHCGKGPSYGWCFYTSYNTEQAHTLLEINASQKDKDYIAAVNWKRAEQCIAEGKYHVMKTEYYHNYIPDPEGDRIAVSEVKKEVKVIIPKECKGVLYFLPTPKSPHGVDVDPTGEYIIAGGKLSTVLPIHSFSKMIKAIKNKDFVGEVDGIPILRYEAISYCEVPNPCLGPLHTEFDGKGYSYTSCFITSEVIKVDYKKCKVVDRAPTYYAVGHLMIPGGDSAKPWGKYLLPMNKITKDRFIPTGPELFHVGQLYDISGGKMQLLLDVAEIGEPHYAQAIPASLVAPNTIKIYELEKNDHPYVTKSEEEAKVVRKGNEVHVYMTTIRSHFTPDNIEGVKVGDTVYFHVTNIEQDWDVPHGFAIFGAENAELLVMPGETKTLVWKPKKPGVYPFYCTDFCSALHQEMQGYVRVSPKGANVTIKYGTGEEMKTAK